MVAKHSRAVRTGENRLGHVLADLAPVDVPRRDDIDIARPVSGHIPVDEADSFVCPAIGIVRDALNERTGTVADTDDCYRSEERRVGQECDSKCRSRRSQYPSKNK